jgi:hypothetical protein
MSECERESMSIGKRAERAIIAPQKTRPFGKLRAGCFAWLAQVPSASSGQALREQRTLAQDDNLSWMN